MTSAMLLSLVITSDLFYLKLSQFNSCAIFAEKAKLFLNFWVILGNTFVSKVWILVSLFENPFPNYQRVFCTRSNELIWIIQITLFSKHKNISVLHREDNNLLWYGEKDYKTEDMLRKIKLFLIKVCCWFCSVYNKLWILFSFLFIISSKNINLLKPSKDTFGYISNSVTSNFSSFMKTYFWWLVYVVTE